MLCVLLVQLPVPNTPDLNVPLAAGYLKAYVAAQGLLDRVAIEILPRAIADHAGDALLVDAIVKRQPDVVGLSLYTWNSERSLHVIERVKQQLPDLRVIVGGPEVQRDNEWVLMHPAVDVAVLGEGEQTFAELLRLFSDQWSVVGGQLADAIKPSLATIPGLTFHDDAGNLIFTPERAALNDLTAIPSPYLLGYLETPPDTMLMIEVSRWCPYACSFCLYGRNMGTKLGNRYFGLERVLREIAWGRERGVTKVHFVEANLNLVPLFWPLMRALADRNADRAMTFYAELRGEHLTDEVVAALDRANVRYVEVGLQTANPDALKASHRRTDLRKWAAGTRRLYDYGIDVYLDVILGLPADDAAGVQHTLDFIRGEALGPYDVFTLQVLPGTAVRQQAATYSLRFQDRPPYYVLATDRFSYAELRRLRRDLKQGADLDPDAIEGMPPPNRMALAPAVPAADTIPVRHLALEKDAAKALEAAAARLASHVDLVVDADMLDQITLGLAQGIAANPATIVDLYLRCDEHPPNSAELSRWRGDLPYQPGYLDRVAVYGVAEPRELHRRVSPRCFLVLPWTATIQPKSYRDVAEIIWQFELGEGDPLPLGAWVAAGGIGIALRFARECTAAYRAAATAEALAWERETGRFVWLADGDADQLAPFALTSEQHLTSPRVEA